MPFYSFLANVNDIIPTLSKLCVVLFVALLGLAFVMGFFKGFRRVSWSGLIWLTASIVFIVISNLASLTPALGVWEVVKTLAIATACVLIIMAGYACLAGLVRPKIRWVKDDVNGDTSLAEYGLEFEPEYLDYDGEDDWKPYGKRLLKTGFLPPSFFAQFLGGVTAMINAAMVALAGVALIIFGLQVVGVKDVLANESLQPLVSFTNKYMLDVLLIGGIFLFAKWGMGKGFAESCASTGLWIVGLGLCGVCLWLPFSVFAKAESGMFLGFANFVRRCVEAGMGISALLGGILGKLLAGMILVAVAMAILVLLNVGMKKLCKTIESVRIMQVMDRCAACLAYAVVGVIACAVVFAALACLEYFGIFAVGGVFSNENAVISKTLFDTILQEVSTLLSSKLG